MQRNQPSEKDIASAERVSYMVGRLPIAIAHTAGYMFTSQTNPEELQQSLETKEAYDICRKPKTWTTPLYEQTLDRVWQIALEELPASAIELLSVIAMLHPDGMSDGLLGQWSLSSSDLDLQRSETRTRSVNSYYRRPLSWLSLKLKA